MVDNIEHIQNNIQLFKELLELESDEENNNDDTKLCLITMLPLDDNHVTLECGHSFNYDPLFKDVYNHKKMFIRLESTPLKTQELRCPYCRKIQPKLLPVKTGCPLIYGVNSLNNKTEIISRKMKQPELYYYNFHTYTKGMCCYGIYKNNILHNGFIETTVTCFNKKVMYNNLNGLVYCADHNTEIICNIFNQEITRLNGLIEKYKQTMENMIGSKKQSAKKKMNSLVLICNNIKVVKLEIVTAYKEVQPYLGSIQNNDKTPSDDNLSDDELEKPFNDKNKYCQQCRCFAYYTSGAKKDTRCVNLGGFGIGNELYCAKHPYIFEK